MTVLTPLIAVTVLIVVAVFAGKLMYPLAPFHMPTTRLRGMSPRPAE